MLTDQRNNSIDVIANVEHLPTEFRVFNPQFFAVDLSNEGFGLLHGFYNSCILCTKHSAQVRELVFVPGSPESAVAAQHHDPEANSETRDNKSGVFGLGLASFVRALVGQLLFDIVCIFERKASKYELGQAQDEESIEYDFT